MWILNRFKRKTELDIEALERRIKKVENELDKLATNGVATAINKLNQEVFKKVKETDSAFKWASCYLTGEQAPKEATLAAKVDAIIEHLGIEVSVDPERVVQRSARVSVKKTKKGSK